MLVVTGMSGAGRSTALKALEDMGYEAVDNLPLSLLPNLVGPQPARHARSPSASMCGRAISPCRRCSRRSTASSARDGLDLKIVFLDCDDELLERRYTETRRRHPLAAERPVADGIRLERERVWPLRGRADLVIDSSALTPADLKRLLHGHFALDAAPGIAIFVTSFAYRHGLPRDADLVFDVRFLRNPHYVDALRPATGRDAAVGAYIEARSRFPPPVRSRSALWLEDAAAALRARGQELSHHRHRLHRRPPSLGLFAERLAAWLRAKGRRVALAHRDLDRSAEHAREPRRRRRASEGHRMIGMVLVTHGRLAAEFIAALEHVVGPQRNIAAVCIGPDDDMEKRRQDILRCVSEVDDGSGVVLLTDMFGGTPSNLAISIMDKAKIEVIAGINLPMLIKLASLRQSETLANAVRGAQEAGRKYINVASQLLADVR